MTTDPGAAYLLAVGVACVAGAVAAVTVLAGMWIGYRLLGCPRCNHRRRLLLRVGHRTDNGGKQWRE